MPMKDFSRLKGTSFSKSIEVEVPQKRGTSIVRKTQGEMSVKDFQAIFTKKLEERGIKYYPNVQKDPVWIKSFLQGDSPEMLLDIIDYLVSEEQDIKPPEIVGFYLISSGYRGTTVAKTKAWKEGRELSKPFPNKPPREYKGTGEGKVTIS